MITGIVRPDLTPTIKLALVGADHGEREIDVEIDSGFNGTITVTSEMIRSLGWAFQFSMKTTLGDGSECRMNIHRGIVIWQGRPRIIDVAESEAQSVLGTALLDGNDLWIQFRPGGEVVITELA